MKLIVPSKFGAGTQAAVVAMGLMLGVAWMALPAAAHGGSAGIEVVSATEVTQSSWGYVIAVTYDGDGHGVDDAQVTAVAEGPGGSVSPVTMTRTDEEGTYEGQLVFPAPGNWTVRFTSVEPEATLEVPQVVESPSTNTTTTSGGGAVAPPSTAESADAPTATVDATPITTTAPDVAVGDDSKRGNGPLLLAVAVVVVVVIGGLIAVRR